MEQWNDGILGPLAIQLFEKAGKDASFAAASIREGLASCSSFLNGNVANTILTIIPGKWHKTIVVMK